MYLIVVKNEGELLLEFAKAIKLFNPSIITGFNDFKFDWPFIKGRLEFFNLIDEFATILNCTGR